MSAPRSGPTRSTVVTIGAQGLVRGFALAGVRVLAAEEPDDVREAWRSLPDEVGLVLLTPDAAQALADVLRSGRIWPLVTVMP